MKELSEIYGARSDATDPNFPGGKFKPESTEGADDGTPLQVNWCNQNLAHIRAPFVKLETVPNDTLDTAVECQSFNRAMDIAKMKSDVFSRAGLCAQSFIGCDSNDPSNAYNSYATGDTIRDACIVFAESDDTPGIAYLQTDGTITFITRNSVNPCWNFDGTFGKADITPVYPSTPDQVEAIACDGTYLFVAWSLDSGHHYVSAFALNALSSAAAWTCDTGIDKIGISDEAVKMVVASSTRLALQVQDGAGGAGSARTTAIITKATGALVATGGGSYAAGYGDDAATRCRPVTDGLSLYWIGYQTVDATRVYYLMSCKLSDPTTSYFASASLETFDTANTWEHPKALAYSRGGVLIMSAEGSIMLYDVTTGYVSSVADIVADPGPNYHGNQDSLSVSDGQNVWLVSATREYLVLVGESIQHIFLRIPTGVFNSDLCALYAAPKELSVSPVVIGGATVEESATNIGGRLLFDGRDIWLITRDGNVFRITNPEVR